MSFEAVNWALGQTVGKASAKFVLVVMAKLAGSDMKCWPSARHLARDTEQDVKTVQTSIKRLRDAGFIEDTGERRGETGQVIVYLLKTPKTGGVTKPDNTPENGVLGDDETPPNFPLNAPENGGAVASETHPNFPAKTPVFPSKTPVFPVKEPQKRGTDKLDKSDKSIDREDSAGDLFGGPLAGVPEQVLADFLKVRKAKKAGDLTQTAIEGIAREAKKAGVTIEAALRMCCERSWVGFKADWATNAGRGQAATPRPPATEPDWRREQRERVQQAAPYAAARREPNPNPEVLDALPPTTL